MRVYYLTGAQFALANIGLRRLKISRFENLNDPFELLGANLSNRAHRREFRDARRKINSTTGLICFTDSWSNPLLWGHYGEKHTGIALGFEVSKRLLEEVIYSTELLEYRTNAANLPILDKKTVNLLLRTKFIDWKYEKEWRMFIELDPDEIESGNFYYQFSPDLELREVILGPRCELPLDGVRSMVAHFKQEVDVIKSRIAFSRFEVLEDKAATRADVGLP